MKLLHIADIHFGIKFLNKNKDVRKKMIDGQKNSFINVIQYLINNSIDALLIAGDLFDSKYRSMDIERFLIEEFNKLAKHKIKVFYCLGNHDSSDTFLESFFNVLPENVIIFKKDAPESYLLKEKLYIHSCGHLSIKESRNLVEDFPKSIENYFNVGLLHCSVLNSINKDDIYLPTDIESLKSKKYDYWALGHIHKRMKLSENIYYSGSLQSLNSKETQEKGGLLIELKDEIIDVRFIPFQRIKHLNLEINFNEIDIEDKYDLFDYIEEEISKIDNMTIVKLTFLGKTELYSYLRDINNLKEINDMILKNDIVVDVKVKNKGLKKQINIEEYISNENILGYIKKNCNDEKFINEIVKEFNLDKIDEDILDIILDFMVGDNSEI